MSNRPPPPPNTRSTKREPRAAAGRRRPTRRWMAEALGVLVIAAVADGSLRAIVAQLDDRVDMIFRFEGGRSSPVLRISRHYCERTRRYAVDPAFRVVVSVPAGVDVIEAAGFVPGDRHVVVSVDCNEVTR